MVDLGPAEKLVLDREDVTRVEAMCLCPGCPAYPEADRGKKVGYCLRGDSPHKEQINAKDCLCEMCEIYKHGKLYGKNFFCMTGAALTKGVRNLLKGKPITDLAEEKHDIHPALVIPAGLDVHRMDDPEKG